MYVGAFSVGSFLSLPATLYRLRVGRPAPIYFRSSVVDRVKLPTTRSAGRPSDVVRYAIVRLLRPGGVIVVLLSISMLSGITTATPMTWRFVPVAGLALGLVVLGFAGRLRSGVVARSKAIPFDEYLALDISHHAAMLRSFSDDDRRVATRTSYRTSDFDFFDVGSRAERFERILSWAVSPFKPAFALSEPTKVGPVDPGIGRVLVPLSAPWEPVALAMIRRCEAVLVLIGTSPSLLWELETLRAEGVVPRTLFVAPPDAGSNRPTLRAVLDAIGLSQHPVPESEAIIGFRVGCDLWPAWYVADRADEHAFAVMAEDFVTRGLPPGSRG